MAFFNFTTKNIVPYLIIFSGFSLTSSSFAQSQANPKADTSLHLEYLSEITLVGSGQQRDVMMLPEVVGTKINAGKKN